MKIMRISWLTLWKLNYKYIFIEYCRRSFKICLPILISIYLGLFSDSFTTNKHTLLLQLDGDAIIIIIILLKRNMFKTDVTESKKSHSIPIPMISFP